MWLGVLVLGGPFEAGNICGNGSIWLKVLMASPGKKEQQPYIVWGLPCPLWKVLFGSSFFYLKLET